MTSTDRRLHWMGVLFPDTIDFPGHTDGIIAPSGLTSERPVSPINGFIRYNTTTKVIEGYVDGVWVVMGDTGSGGVATFTDLSDTPNSYLGSANRLLRVNIGTTGIEFIDGNTLFLPLAGGTMNTGANITMSGATITGVPSPQFNNDVANKEYVDGIAAGLAVKESVHSATTANINLAIQGLAGIDGHATYTDGDRVLVKDQTIPSENGIYAAHAGPWTRTTDMDGTPANEVQGGTTTYVQDGTANGDTNWVVIWDGNVDVGTDPMNWSLIAAGSSQNLWETIQDDAAGTISATGPTDTLIVAGGTGITTAVAGTTLTVTNDSPNVDQNVFGKITGTIGTTDGTASQVGKILHIIGDSTISTAITNNDPVAGEDTITLKVLSAAPGSRLQDSDNNTFIELESVAPDSNNIRIETGVNSGAGGNVDIVNSAGAPDRDGGSFSLTTGDGGTEAAIPTNGGAVSISSGAGGVGTLSIDGGNGGSIQITSGAGGDGADGADGGDITITAGDYGITTNASVDGFGGDIILLPGGSGIHSGEVTIGRASHKWPNTDGTANQVLTTDGAGNLSFAAAQAAAVELPRPYDLAAQVLGNVTASSMIFKFVAPRDMILFDFGHQAQSETTPPVDADFDVTVNGSTIGTIRYYASGGADPTAFDFGGAGGFPGSSAGAVQHAISRGDIIRVIAPATSTVGFDDVSITLRGGVEPNIPVGSLSANFSAPGLDPSSLTLNVTGEFTHIEYACVAISTDSGTNWYPLDAHEHGFGTTSGVNMNSTVLDSESKYLTDTDTTPSIFEITGSGNRYRVQATVYGPGGIVTTFVDAQFGGA